jgi:hypothetical protein
MVSSDACVLMVLAKIHLTKLAAPHLLFISGICLNISRAEKL